MGKKTKPGWYPDPSTQGRQERWWDGSDWTERVRSFAAPDTAPPTARKGGSRIPARFAVPILIVLIGGGVIAYAMARDQDVEGVKLSDSGIEVAFASSGSVSSTEIEAKQADLEQQVRALRDNARSEASSRPPPPATTDLSGNWLSPTGLRYQIQQFGANAVITEMSPWGISAAGQGTVNGDEATFAYQAADGTTGQAVLRLTDDSTLEGTFTNHTVGTTVPVRLTR
jgi:uncharacterized protein DUF2510